MKAAIGLLFALAAVPWHAAAQAPPESPASPSLLERAGVTATLRMGLWSSTHDLDGDGPLGAGMLWGKATRSLNRHVSVFGEGWAALRGPATGGDVRGELREAFVNVTAGPLEVRAGRQIIAWGRADGINPTDNLTGQDLTLLAPDDSDRRLGATSVKVSYFLRDVSATVIWIPEFRSHRVPLPPVAGDLPSSTSRWTPEQVAFRVEQTGRAVDWSLSAYSGFDLSPDLGLDLAGAAPQLTLKAHRIRVVGGDAAGNVGSYGLRAEAAYVRTDDHRGIDPFVKNSFVAVVAGGDRTFREHLNVNLQYLFRYVTDFARAEPPDSPAARFVTDQQAILSSQARRIQQGASARVSYRWLHDTLEAELAGSGFAFPKGIALRPKVTYAVSDRLKLLAGAEIYRGESSSVFGILRANSGGYVEARWSF
jgi:hypothetical protein